MTHKQIHKHLDRLEKLIEGTLAFSARDDTSIATGPTRIASAENTANVVAMENARRAVLNMRGLWK